MIRDLDLNGFLVVALGGSLLFGAYLLGEVLAQRRRIRALNRQLRTEPLRLAVEGIVTPALARQIIDGVERETLRRGRPLGHR